MWKLLKKKDKCDHHWYHVKDDFVVTCIGGHVESEDGCWIYCPKCKKERLVFQNEWERINRKQEIDKQYNEVDKVEFNRKTTIH